MINYEALAKHRADLKKELKDLLKSNQRVACVQPTGMGKSHIIAELCQEFKGKKLVLEPGNSIINYMEQFDIETPNTDYITYHSLLRPDIQDIVRKFKDYDYIFLDEMHRALAETWGTKLMDVLSSLDKITTYKLIGFSATPIRSDNRDAVEELFNNIQTKPYYLADAILDNLLPNIDYHTSIYEITDKQKKKLKLEDTPIAKAILSYDIDEGVSNLISEVIDLNKNHKIICFVDRINNIPEAVANIKKWFKVDINIFEAHSRYSENRNNKSLCDFQQTNGLNILFAVNILNEGVHIPGVDTVIFLRKTKSGIIYNQQLGRVISDNTKDPVVLDLVNNSLNLEWGYSMIFKDKIRDLKIQANELTCINGEKLKITTHQTDIINILNSIKTKTRILTQEDKDFLNKHSKEFTVKALASKLKCSTSAVYRYCISNNLKYKCSYEVREYENFIKEHEGEYTINELSSKLNIERHKVYNFCKSHKIKFKYETPRKSYLKINPEIASLIEHNISKFYLHELAEFLNISKGSLKQYCKKHNLKAKTKDIKPVSEDFKTFIKEHEGEYTTAELGKMFNMTNYNVYRYCYNHNIKFKPSKLKLSAKQLNFIKEHEGEYTTTELGKMFNVSTDYMYGYCKYHKIKTKVKASGIPEDFKTFIKEHEGEYTINELSEMFSINVKRLQDYCYYHNIKFKSNKVVAITPEIAQYIINNSGNFTLPEISKKFNIRLNTLHSFCKQHNIKYKKGR